MVQRRGRRRWTCTLDATTLVLYLSLTRLKWQSAAHKMDDDNRLLEIGTSLEMILHLRYWQKNMMINSHDYSKTHLRCTVYKDLQPRVGIIAMFWFYNKLLYRDRGIYLYMVVFCSAPRLSKAAVCEQFLLQLVNRSWIDKRDIMFSDFGSKLSKGMKGLGLTTSPSKKARFSIWVLCCVFGVNRGFRQSLHLTCTRLSL